MPKQTYVHTLSSTLAERLQTRYMGREMRCFECIESTNSVAEKWAESGVPEGALVMAEYQTGGRGRHGRNWESEASRNLLFSIVLRPDLPPTHLGLITVAASLAVAETIDDISTPVYTQIKWPNDILLNHRKCCGMLLETAYSSQKYPSRSHVVLGIGLNVNQTSFSPDIADRSTSLLLETGRHTDRVELLANLLHRLERYYDPLSTETGPSLVDEYKNKLAYLHTTITVRSQNSNTVRNVYMQGVSETGALRVRTESGVEELHAGEVTTSSYGDLC